MNPDDEEETTVGGSQKHIKKEDKLTTFHMTAFIICAMIGREYKGWQASLSQGFGQFMINQVLQAATFIVCYLYLADIWSAVPFSGGLYGLSRAVIGFYPGFLIGCADAFLYTAHSAIGALFLAQSIIDAASLPQESVIGIVVLVYAIAVALAIQPSVVVQRRSFVALAGIAILILVFWLLGSLKFVDFLQNASLHRAKPASAAANWFSGGMTSYLLWLPNGTLPYAGTKAFTLMVSFTAEPKKTLPRAVLIALPFIFCLNLFAVFVFASQPGGILHTASLPNPMRPSWRQMFKLTVDAGNLVTNFLTFPASFARVYAYVLPCGALFQSLGRTNLLPSFLRLYGNKDHTNGTIVTAIIGFIMCLWLNYQPQLGLSSMCLPLTAITNLAGMYCYIKLKFFCPTLEKGYTMPLGIPGAVLVILMQVLLFIAVAAFSNNTFPIFGVAALWFVLTIYYFAFAEKGQTLCKEEDKVFLLLHVKNFNQNRKKRRHHKGNRVQPSAAGGGGGAHVKSPANNGSSHHASSSEPGASTTRVVSEQSAQLSPAAELWAKFRRLNFFGNNTVSPDQGIDSSHGASSCGSGHGSEVDAQSPRTMDASRSPVPDAAAFTAAAEEPRAAEDSVLAEGSTRRVEPV